MKFPHQQSKKTRLTYETAKNQMEPGVERRLSKKREGTLKIEKKPGSLVSLKTQAQQRGMVG